MLALTKKKNFHQLGPKFLYSRSYLFSFEDNDPVWIDSFLLTMKQSSKICHLSRLSWFKSEEKNKDLVSSFLWLILASLEDVLEAQTCFRNQGCSEDRVRKALAGEISLFLRTSYYLSIFKEWVKFHYSSCSPFCLFVQSKENSLLRNKSMLLKSLISDLIIPLSLSKYSNLEIKSSALKGFISIVRKGEIVV